MCKQRENRFELAIQVFFFFFLNNMFFSVPFFKYIIQGFVHLDLSAEISASSGSPLHETNDCDVI